MRERLQNHMHRQWYVYMSACCAIILVLVVLVIFQVRFFTQQVAELVRLKEDYKNYEQGLRRMIADTQSKAHELGALKKKIAPDEGAFTCINRDVAYLRLESAAYARAHGLYDQWQALSASMEEGASSVRARKKRVSPRQRSHLVRRHTRTVTLDGDLAAVVQRHSFIVPLESHLFWVSSPYGPRARSFHYGIDLAAPFGTPVRAAGRGVIVEAGRNGGFGKTVVVAHSSECKTRYAHLSSIDVEVGDTVEQGQRVGRVGNTGNTRGRNGVHLHLEVLVYGKQVDPQKFFKQLRRV